MEMMRYTSLGFYYLCTLGALLLLGVRREVNLLLLAAGMMVWPMWLNYRMPLKILKSISLRLRVPDVVGIGEKAPCEAELITNSRHRFGGVTPFLLLPGGHFQLEKVQEFTPKRANTHRVLTWRISFDRRGEYPVSGLKLTCSYPFGLLKNSRTFEESGKTVLVPPRLAEVPDLEEALGNAVDSEDTIRDTSLLRRMSGDFAGLRPWMSGDFWRQIHWRASGRHDQILVQNFDTPPRPAFCLIADFSNSSAEHFEDHVSYAASVSRKVYQSFQQGSGTGVTASLWLVVVGKNLQVMSTEDVQDFYYAMLRTFALVERRPDNAPAADVSKLLEEFREKYPRGEVLALVSED